MGDNLLANKAKHELVWAKMRELNIDTITVSFSGEGDSGSISDIYIGDDYATENQLRAVPIDLLDEHGHKNLYDLIFQLSEDILTDRDIVENWWDNDGGYGELFWELSCEDMPEGTPGIRVELEVRIVSTQSHAYTFDRHGEEYDDASTAS